jgi:fructokinase
MGEALIDIIIDQQGDVSSVVGGAPLNTARTIARLGGEIVFIGGISGDSFGQRITRELVADGVTLGIEQPMLEPSPVALASLDDTGAATYRFLIDGTAASSVTSEQAMRAFDPQARALHVGTLAFVLSPLAHATSHVIDSMEDQQVLMIDPNARPAVMADPILFALFSQTLERALNRADLVKVSGDDLELLYPDVDPGVSARMLHDSSQATVLFTDGSKSVRIYVQGSELVLAVPLVPVVDTVGAGDSFSGGFLRYWTQQGWARDDCKDILKVEAAARFGIRVAGLTCQKPGAQPPFAHEL